MPSGSDARQVAEDLGQELLRLHMESYGKGAQESRVLLDEDTVVCVMDGLELLPSEEFLIEAGKGDAVVEVRGRYQQAIESSFRAAVERHTGRRVTSFASVTRLDPHYIVEIFRLAPATDEGLREPDDA
jgi:uncharacterized protein YbcI